MIVHLVAPHSLGFDDFCNEDEIRDVAASMSKNGLVVRKYFLIICLLTDIGHGI
jgi:hypothetical protein